MKWISNLLGMAAACVMGYLVEPTLRFTLTGVERSAVEKGRNTKFMLQMPGTNQPVELATFTPEQLPQRVHLNVDVKLTDPSTDITMILPAGNTAKVVRVEGGNVVVSPGEGPYTGLIAVGDTDIIDQISADPSKYKPRARNPQPVTPPVAPPVTRPTPQVTPPSQGEEPPARTFPTPRTPEPAPERPPLPESSPAPAPIPEAAPPANAATIIKVMQDSIKSAQIKEFTFAQVLDWKADAPESTDGDAYQTGVASYKAETIFGVKTIQAKALIKGGKVVRWIWPKSGMEIK